MLPNTNIENSSDDITFDEKAFLRKARFKSIIRITLISLCVAIGIFVLSFVIPEIMLGNQENRINSFYPNLVKFTEPNTFALSGESYNVRLLGRQKKYYLFRLIGDKPHPAGTITVDFDAWGGEQTNGNNYFSVSNSKEYLIPYAVPKLRFYNPAASYEKIIREFDTLKNIPKNQLVEMAISFNKPLTLDEIKVMMPQDLKLMWGAVRVFKDEDYENAVKNAEEKAKKNGRILTQEDKENIKRNLAERLVGNPYLDSTNGEKEFIQELEVLVNIPSYHSNNIKRTVSFLKENGIKYYGVVVVGSPESLEKLSSNPMITGAVLGIVTTPY